MIPIFLVLIYFLTIINGDKVKINDDDAIIRVSPSVCNKSPCQVTLKMAKY